MVSDSLSELGGGRGAASPSSCGPVMRPALTTVGAAYELRHQWSGVKIVSVLAEDNFYRSSYAGDAALEFRGTDI
jgi:hypothetical protein